MKRTFTDLPPAAADAGTGAHVGLIGCGNFAFGNIAHYLAKNYGRVIRGVMDVEVNRAASLFQKYKAAYYTDDAERIIADPAIDMVYIASNHASHAEYAIRALATGKHVHIEKPHVVNQDQLVRLCKAMQGTSARVTLGFNRPNSLIGRKIRDSLAAQEGPSVFNWFVAGHEIPPDHWYFRAEEGGRVLGNLCHWTDFIFSLVPPERRHPIVIRPTRAVKSDSDIAVTYLFGDGTIAAITFSAKGHTFEGVREVFSGHRGNVLISMSDFKHLVIETVDRKYHHRALFRDHGHEAAIRRSYEMTRAGGQREPGCPAAYVWESGELFLKTKEALDRNVDITVHAFDPARAFAA
jgi:predicted dehydrogenase